MDYSSSGVRQPGHRSSKKSKMQRSQPPTMYNPYAGAPIQNPQLFEDTSVRDSYGQPYPGMNAGNVPGYVPPEGYLGSQLLQDPMISAMAMNYVGQGKEIVDKKLEKYISVSKLKYYFAVDTNYVAKKLALLFFPFTHSDWSMKYNQDEPVAPRFEINAPDLYIPVMAFVTYILITGYVMGTQNRFSPEHLGIQASSAFVWLIIEILAIVFTIYITRMKSQIKTWDLVAFCSYKYVGMISCLIAYLLINTFGYYCILIYSSASIGFFLVRTMRLQLMPDKESDMYGHGTKRRMYLLLFIALIQPVMMYWLTHHVVTIPTETVANR